MWSVLPLSKGASVTHQLSGFVQWVRDWDRSLTLAGALENRACNVKVRAGDLDSWDPEEGGGWGPTAGEA